MNEYNSPVIKQQDEDEEEIEDKEMNQSDKKNKEKILLIENYDFRNKHSNQIEEPIIDDVNNKNNNIPCELKEYVPCEGHVLEIINFKNKMLNLKGFYFK